MTDKLEYMDFPGDPFDVCHIDDFIFLEDFDGYFFACDRMCGGLDFTECAFA